MSNESNKVNLDAEFPKPKSADDPLITVRDDGEVVSIKKSVFDKLEELTKKGFIEEEVKAADIKFRLRTLDSDQRNKAFKEADTAYIYGRKILKYAIIAVDNVKIENMFPEIDYNAILLKVNKKESEAREQYIQQIRDTFENKYINKFQDALIEYLSKKYESMKNKAESAMGELPNF